MKIQEYKTVGEIAVNVKGAVGLFERQKIDYCCGGNRSLQEACSLAGLQVEEVIKVLEKNFEESGEDQADWKSKSFAQLIDHILQKHHVYTRETLQSLKNLSAKVAKVHGEKHPELSEVEEIVHLMAEEMDGHMTKEEDQVFPYLKALEANKGNKQGVTDPFKGGPVPVHPLKVLMWEHGMTGQEFEHLHQLTNDLTPPPDACRSYTALYAGLRELEMDLHQHVHLENNVLFEKAMAAGYLD